VARVLIIGAGCRGRELASTLTADGHAVRITTRTEAGRAAIEQAGAECFIGDPDRLATLRGSLDHVAVVCWLLACAQGTHEQLRALHSSRLEQFLGQAIDTTMRGFVYEARGTSVPAAMLGFGADVAQAVAAQNAIPVQLLGADPEAREAWLADARSAIGALLEQRPT
jgi:hypothetical protein